MRIGYYKCQAKAERNKEFRIHVLYDDTKAWESRTIGRRSLTFVLSREAHPHEVDAARAQKRAVSFKYRTLDGLIDDEMAAGTDSIFISKIKKSLSGSGGLIHG